MTAQGTAERIHIEDFYPTPSTLIAKLLAGVKVQEVGGILEPSAGKGDICEYIKRQFSTYSYRKPEIDCIEINPDLRHILKGKEFNVIHDDFLTFDTFKAYGLIVANFPFSEGDKHLAKALQLLEKSGGQLRCLVNAETIRNPYTKLRETINAKLSNLGAEIEYLENEFRDAERKTNVEVALIRLEVVKEQGPSVILDSLKQAETFESAENQDTTPTHFDFMDSLAARFNLECRAGLKLIDECFSLQPYILNVLPRKGADNPYTKPLISLWVRDGEKTSRVESINAYLRGVRRKYWAALLDDPRFRKNYTSNILKDIENKLNQLEECDFTVFNIHELEQEMNGKITEGVEKAILDLFDEFSRQYAWYKECTNNIHYYNGWATNKAHKINKKVIIPLNGFSSYGWDKCDRLQWDVKDKLNDIVKVFNYLSDKKEDVPQLVSGAVELANHYREFSGIDLRYFDVTFYKKGTCHIKFKDERLLEKFNIFGSQRKGWLPPAYGKKSYQDMTREEKHVVEDFQGRGRYEEILKESSYYLVETKQLLLEA